MRLGILGGTFDPPHVGHLLPAIDVLEALALDRILFVPAASQPLKVGRDTAPAHDRVAMVRALTALHPAFETDPVEVERAGLSYTVDTLETVAARDSGAELFFLAGTDVVSSFSRWRDPERILGLARFVLVRRAGSETDVMPTPFGREPLVVETRRVDVSSTEIRARVRAGKPIGGFVPDAVAEHIARAALYR